MYEVNRSGFPVKKVILTILILVIIFFILMWLFPTKGYLSNNKENASVVKTFSENIELIKDAAMGYYTDERLPQDTGDKDKMALDEMLDKHLITEPVDSNNERCDLQKSYVEVTKEETEYLMKINLACKDKTDYISAHMGSYTYCVGDICEKKNLTNNEASKENETTKNSETTGIASTTSTAAGNCKFVRTSVRYTNYGNWSGWTKTKIAPSNTRKVQMKTVKEKTGETTKVTTVEGRYKAQKISSGGQTVYVCSSAYKNEGRYARDTACLKDISTYRTVPVYSNVTYYRYQDRKAYYDNDVKWASCNKTLKGYRKVS